MANDNLETILGVKLILPSAAQESSGASAQTNRESDEEYDTIPVLELEGRTVKLGRLGENNTQTVKIDCSAWLTALPGCQLMIAALRPGESEIYLPGVSVASGVVKVERPNQEQATMVSYTLTLDDDIVVAQGTLTEAGETEFNYVLDTAGLTEATHTLTATFWNSFGESVIQETQFYAGDLGLNNDGDVNGDGSVDVGDIMNVINCMAGISLNADKADVNGDGSIDVGDIMAIINKMAGL